MPTVRTDDGVHIAYKTLGDGPRHLLFMHGWGTAGTGHVWDEMLKHLNLTGLRLILVDLRGHGMSDKATTGFTTERFAQDMFTVADDAAADELIAVGFSMSGKWAQWMACFKPDRVIGQILIAPVPAMELPLPEGTEEHWLRCVRNREMFRDLVGQFTRQPLPPEILDLYFNEVTHTSPFSLSATLKMVEQGSFVDQLRATHAATLVIGGQHDPMCPPDFLRQIIVSAIPGARLALLDCGHETPFEKPRETAMLLEAFLAGLG